MTKVLYNLKPEEAKLHISSGNSKIGKGVYNFSTLPGNAENVLTLGDQRLTNVEGTCSKYCNGCFNGGCYAVNSAKLHHNCVIRAWGENTLLLRKGVLFSQISSYITAKNLKYLNSKQPEDKVIELFRINVSGEITSVTEFEEWNKIALKHPEIAFGLYTKAFDVLDEFLQKHPEGFAKNFCINISQWNHVADEFLAKYPNKFNIFEYDETNRSNCDWSEEERKRLSKLVHCPAVDKKGHHTKKVDGSPLTCKDCGRCYTNTGRTTAVYSH